MADQAEAAGAGDEGGGQGHDRLSRLRRHHPHHLVRKQGSEFVQGEGGTAGKTKIAMRKDGAILVFYVIFGV